jgi:MFS family permease
MVGDFGSVMGPLVAGFLADHYGFEAGFLTAVLIVIPALLLAIRMPETKAPDNVEVPEKKIPGTI